MSAVLRRLVAPFISGSTWKRWAYLILGGAVLTPYVLLALIVLPAALPDLASGAPAAFTLLALGVVIPVLVLTAFIPAVRLVEGTAITELLGGPAAERSIAPARSWPDRWRTAGWFVLHIVVGGVISVLTLIIPPTTVLTFAAPFGRGRSLGLLSWRLDAGWAGAWEPVLGVALLAGLILLVAGMGGVLARLAPFFLGPSPAERLAELEARAAQLAERNRLARELHDSVGHVLSIVTVQAGAAGRIIDTDPGFARQALTAIEESARSALDDLDHVLGLLREERGSTTPMPTLAALDGLLNTTRLAGVEVCSDVIGSIDAISPAVSREAYRIVQEGLTNAMRHAGRVPVTLRLVVHDHDVELEMTNPIAATRRRPRRGGGRGLAGMRERVTVLHGQMTAAAEDDLWRIAVRLPLRSAS